MARRACRPRTSPRCKHWPPRRTWCAPHSVRTPPMAGFFVFCRSVTARPSFPPPFSPLSRLFALPALIRSRSSTPRPRDAETGTECCSAGRQAPGHSHAETGTCCHTAHSFGLTATQKRVRIDPSLRPAPPMGRRNGYAAKIFCALVWAAQPPPGPIYPHPRRRPAGAETGTPRVATQNPAPAPSPWLLFAETGTGVRRSARMRLRRNGYAPAQHWHGATCGCQVSLQ